MTRRKLNILLIIGVVLGVGLATPQPIVNVLAITAEEMLADPALEKRARNLSKQLRCLVCQNQSIDDSDADLAKDLRNEVRAQLIAGKTDNAILSDLRAKYGDYVLLAPPLAKDTAVLWLAPVGFILLGISIAFSIRRRATSSQGESISNSDRTRIDLLKKHHQKTNKRDTK